MTRPEAVTPEGDRWNDPQSPAAVGDFAKGLRRRWKLVVGVTALAVAVALVVSLVSASKYDATAKLVFGAGTPVEALGEGAAAQADEPERVLKTNAQLLTEENIARRVIAELGLPLSPDELLDKVSVDTEQDSDIVALTVRDERPEQAARIANAFASEYVEFRREAARSNLDEAAELARRRLESMTPEERASQQGRELEARVRELEISAALQTGGVELVREASVPDERSSPRPVVATIVAALLGLLLGAALALLIEAADRRLRSEDDIEELFGLPLLATIARPAGRAGATGHVDGPAQNEGYATLATNLRFFKLGPEVRSLVITSPSAGEGKTSVTLGLARALTGLGLRVVAVEADIRQPMFGRRLALPRRSGLSSILAGASTFAEEVVEIDGATREAVELGGGASGASFWVLPSGPIPPNPQALLATTAMRAVLAEASEFADVVLIDTPPIGVVNDAATLVDQVDGTLVVARLNATTRDRARRAMRVLANLRAPTLGVVVTNVRPRAGSYYQYDAGLADRGARSRSAV